MSTTKEPLHKLVMFSEADGNSFYVRLGNGPVLITDGYGGWVSVARPQNKPLTRWDGGGPLTLQIPLLFDRPTNSGYPIKEAVRKVLRLGRDAGGTQEPQPFGVKGNFFHSGKRYVMAGSPEFTTVHRGRSGQLMRVELTITVIEYVRPDRIKFRKIKKKRRRVRAKKGDTINKIAHRVYKGKSKAQIRKLAQKMAKLNDVRNRSAKLKQGRIIKIP